MYQSISKVIQTKLGLFNLAEALENVSIVMSLSRDTFYLYKSAVEQGGVEALFEKNRRQSNLKNCVDETTELKVLPIALEFPAHQCFPSTCAKLPRMHYEFVPIVFL